MTDLGASGSGGGRPYELVRDACGLVARISGRGAVVLATPAVNRGTAFTHQERRDLGLLGLLPARVSTVEEQIRRAEANLADPGFVGKAPAAVVEGRRKRLAELIAQRQQLLAASGAQAAGQA